MEISQGVESKGKIKQVVGDLIGNNRLKREGRTQGQVEGAVKDTTHTVKDAVKDAKRAVNGRIQN
jgi:uncharacterized protein YjbJ (UPF0337 family)